MEHAMRRERLKIYILRLKKIQGATRRDSGRQRLKYLAIIVVIVHVTSAPSLAHVRT